MTRKGSLMMVLLATGLVLCCLASSVGATAYVFRDLGRLGGLTDERTAPQAINYAGQVAGTANSAWTPTTDPIYRAFAWTPEQGMQALGTLGGTNSWAHGINGAGQIVGAAETAGGQMHAVLWSPGQPVQDLGVLPGYTHSRAYGINDAGLVVGSAGPDPWTAVRACLWTLTPLTPPQDLGTLGGATASARAINNSNRIVGYAQTAGGQDHACLWVQGQPNRDLGVPAGGAFSRAYAINAAGNVVGTADYTPGVGAGHAFYWDHVTETMQDIIPSQSESHALSINDFNRAAGEAINLAFLWAKDSNSTEALHNLLILNKPSTNIYFITAYINNRGQIVGYYNDDNETAKAYLLTPIAQPPLLILILD